MKADPKAWADTFETNVAAQFFVSAGFLPLLAKSRDATPGYTPSIINITSISSVMKGSSGGQFAYSCSKAAFIQQTRNLATTFAEAKVRVNSIAPGVFPSEMTTGKSDENQKSEVDDSKASTPAGRYGKDTDMGACLLFLAGRSGVFLNGQIVYPDGGKFQHVFTVASYVDNGKETFWYLLHMLESSIIFESNNIISNPFANSSTEICDADFSFFLSLDFRVSLPLRPVGLFHISKNSFFSTVPLEVPRMKACVHMNVSLGGAITPSQDQFHRLLKFYLIAFQGLIIPRMCSRGRRTP